MLENKCCELLGVRVNWASNTPEAEVTLKSLTDAIERSIESRLIRSLVEIKRFAAVQLLDNDSLLLLKSGDNLMGLRSDNNLEFSALIDGKHLFRALDDDGLLHEVAPQPIVDEYTRLSDIIMADRIARSEENDRKRDRDELERLLKMRDNGLI